jgi:hypothetical protein
MNTQGLDTFLTFIRGTFKEKSKVILVYPKDDVGNTKKGGDVNNTNLPSFA